MGQSVKDPFDPDAPLTELLPAVYDQLRALASSFMRDERRDHTLDPTALVHEAYLRLRESKKCSWRDRAHFYRSAARTMRQILVNHAIRKNRLRRGGNRQRVALSDLGSPAEKQDVDLVLLDELLNQLGRIDAQKAQIVELRFFAGCTIEESAEALGVSTATVERDWKMARAWLHSELSRAEEPD